MYMKYKGLWLSVAIVYLFTGLFTVCAADGPSLGANWPNSADVSRSVNHHIYRWQRQGVTYVQVNSATGQPQMAFAYTATGSLVLPVGEPDKVQVDLGASQNGGEAIFDDGVVTVVETPTGYTVNSSPSSASRMQVMDQSTCNGDPIECSRVN